MTEIDRLTNISPAAGLGPVRRAGGALPASGARRCCSRSPGRWRRPGARPSCAICGNLDEAIPAPSAATPRRDATLLCVVEDVADFVGSSGLAFCGAPCLGGTLFGPRRDGPVDLDIDGLVRRAADGVGEVIIALTPPSRARDRALPDRRLAPTASPFTRLAHGVPVAASSTISTKAR